jgi:hypothetical protein
MYQKKRAPAQQAKAVVDARPATCSELLVKAESRLPMLAHRQLEILTRIRRLGRRSGHDHWVSGFEFAG